jgi:hypothetical protein
MRVNGYRCDGCGKEHLLAPYHDVRCHGGGLPSGWFVVMRSDHKADEEPWTFCSKACLCSHSYGAKSTEESVLTPAEIDRRATPEYWRDL